MSEQVGFRECYGIGNQVTNMIEVIEDAFMEKKKVFALWVDSIQAVEEVRKALALKLKPLYNPLSVCLGCV